MGTVQSIFGRNPSIHAKCIEKFPNSPEFAKYLSDRICDLGGGVEIAELLCRSLLKNCTSKSPRVPAECVVRLGLDTDTSCIRKINEAHPGGHRLVAFNTMCFLLSATGTISVPVQFESIDALLITERNAIRNIPDLEIAYVRLFSCASAMLAGVTIDPRAQVA